ncbi:hypothetical protein ACFZBP_33255 [Streptomyces sp. NPDC008086]|uniref:hypothetical protein n=1 Tax=unclassified Streptomyces TaxID=2593676 RepID=UPI0036ACA0CA
MTSPSGGSDNRGSATEPQLLVCARCGARADAPQPTWTCSVENGARHYICDTCSRENLRAIEGRLDSAWW